MKRLLLTGCGGSIATHTMAHIFTHTDWEIVGIDSFRHRGWTDRVTGMFEKHPEWEKRLTVFTHDLTAPISPVLRNKIGHIDYIINMASLSDVEASIQDPVPFVRNNVELVMSVLEYARLVKPDVFIQISTDEVYGPTDGKHRHKEWEPIVPSNPYAASKAAQEAICISYWRSYSVPLIITNFMNNFGEYQSSTKYPLMLQKWISKGDKVTVHGALQPDGTFVIGSRSYIHSRNTADALLYIIKNLPPHKHIADDVDKPDRYNIAGDKQLDNLELARVIAKLMGREDFDYEVVNVHTTRPGHDRHYGLSSEKIKKLGWESPMSFEDSLKKTIDWYEQHNDWL